MTRFAGRQFGTDFTDPSSYAGKGWDLDATGGAHIRRRSPAGLAMRAAGATVVLVVAAIVAWHLLGFLVGVVYFAVKMAILAGLVALVVAGVRRMR
jgi:hypothetical protein